jgi:heme exporter protein D
MEKRHHNWLAIYNEAVVYSGCVLMVMFTDYIKSPEQRHELGYLFIYWLAVTLVTVNFVVLFVDITLSLAKKSKRLRKLQKKKKRLAIE